VPQFNVFWLDPINPDTFPAGLLDAVTPSTAAVATAPGWSGRDEERSVEERLREQMRADALQSLDDDDDDNEAVTSSPKNADLNRESHLPLTRELIEDAAQFLCLNVSVRPSAANLLTLPRAPLYFFSLGIRIG
jgi:hypothetical protein